MFMRAVPTALFLVLVAGCDNGALPTAPSDAANVLPPFEPPIAGEYTLMLKAASSCLLPSQSMERRYTARITEPSRGSVTVDLSGAVFMPQLPPGFTGTRDGNTLEFGIGRGNDRWVAERIDETMTVIYRGDARATLAGTSITGTFSGEIWVSHPDSVYDWLGDCTAVDHRIEFARR